MSAPNNSADAAPRGTIIALMILALLLMTIDGADLSVMPLSVPYVSRDLGIPPAEFGLVLSAMPMGLGIGALLIGPYGDRYGRRPLIIGGLFAIAIATAATALASSLPAFLVLRLLTGAGLGACLTNINPLVAQIIPHSLRARALTFNSSGIPIGAAAAGFAAPLVVAASSWKGMFLLLGAFVFCVAVASWKWLPETPNFRRADAKVSDPAKGQGGIGRFALIAPLRSPYTLMTAVFIGLYTLNAFSLYMLSAWLPTVLPQAGFSLAAAARLSSIMQLGGLVGGFLISTFVDRSAAMPALLTSYALVFLSLLAFNGVPAGYLGWGGLLLVVGAGITGAHLSIMALGTLFYPPRVTASALGLATAIARLGAIAGPLYGQMILEHKTGVPAFFLALCVPVGICAALVCLIPAVERRRDAIAQSEQAGS